MNKIFSIMYCIGYLSISIYLNLFELLLYFFLGAYYINWRIASKFGSRIHGLDEWNASSKRRQQKSEQKLSRLVKSFLYYQKNSHNWICTFWQFYCNCLIANISRVNLKRRRVYHQLILLLYCLYLSTFSEAVLHNPYEHYARTHTGRLVSFLS